MSETAIAASLVATNCACVNLVLNANAIKACGSIIRVSPEDFTKVVNTQENPLIVMAKGGLFSTYYKYLTSYKNFCFYTKTSYKLQLKDSIELIAAKKISVPDI